MSPQELDNANLWLSANQSSRGRKQAPGPTDLLSTLPGALFTGRAAPTDRRRRRPPARPALPPAPQLLPGSGPGTEAVFPNTGWWVTAQGHPPGVAASSFRKKS